MSNFSQEPPNLNTQLSNISDLDIIKRLWIVNSSTCLQQNFMNSVNFYKLIYSLLSLDKCNLKLVYFICAIE